VAPGKPKVASAKPKVVGNKPKVAAVKPKPAASKPSAADESGPGGAPSKPTAAKKIDKPVSNGGGSGDEDVEGFVDVNEAGVRAHTASTVDVRGVAKIRRDSSIYSRPPPFLFSQHKWAPRDELEAPVNEEDARKRLQELTFDFSFG
jgi:hypothetical protein